MSGNEIDNVQDLYYPGCQRLFMRGFLLRSSLYKHCSMDLVKSNCCSVSFSAFTDYTTTRANRTASVVSCKNQ